METVFHEAAVRALREAKLPAGCILDGRFEGAMRPKGEPKLLGLALATSDLAIMWRSGPWRRLNIELKDGDAGPRADQIAYLQKMRSVGQLGICVACGSDPYGAAAVVVRLVKAFIRGEFSILTPYEISSYLSRE